MLSERKRFRLSLAVAVGMFVLILANAQGPVSQTFYSDGDGIIAMHDHILSGGSVDAFVAAMDKHGIDAAVMVPTGGSPDNRGYRENTETMFAASQQHPGRIIPFCTVNGAEEDAPQWLRDCIRRGGKGLKLIYHNVPWNDRRMYKAYAVVAEEGVPVLIHVEPREPDKTEFERAVRDWPNVTFIVAHYCREYLQGPSMPFCRHLLDTYPNVNFDISTGTPFPNYVGQVQNDREGFRNFLMEYKDRVAGWGTDIFVTRATQSFAESRMACELALLREERFSCTLSGLTGDYTGLALPQEVLDNILSENPRRLLGL